MKKLYNKILTINVKKNIIYTIIIGIIFCIVAGTGFAIKFGDRIQNSRQQLESFKSQNSENSESDQEKSNEDDKKDNNEKNENTGKKEDKKEIIIKNMNLDITDYVFLAIVFVVSIVIAVYYWLLVLLYSIKKSEKVGTSKIIFGIITLFTNVLGVILLHLYISIKTTCPNCGRIQRGNVDYCSNCGQKMKIKCPNCGNIVSVFNKYCTKCGTKIK